MTAIAMTTVTVMTTRRRRRKRKRRRRRRTKRRKRGRPKIRRLTRTSLRRRKRRRETPAPSPQRRKGPGSAPRAAEVLISPTALLSFFNRRLTTDVRSPFHAHYLRRQSLLSRGIVLSWYRGIVGRLQVYRNLPRRLQNPSTSRASHSYWARCRRSAAPKQ